MNFRVLFLIIPLVVLFMAGCGGRSAKGRHLNAAERYFREEQFLSAEIGYKNLLQQNPGDPLALRRLGAIWLKRGGLLRAAGFLSDAEKALPDDLEVKADLAETMLGLGYVTDANRKAREILNRQPLNERALPILVDSSATPEAMAEADEYLWNAKDGDLSAALQVAKAKLAMQQGNFIEAELKLNRALSLDPDLVGALGLKAALSVIKDDPEQATAAFQRAIELGSKYSTDRVKYALFLMRIGKSEDAETYLASVTKEVPDFLSAWRLRAQIAASARKFDEAKHHLGVVLKMNPPDVDANLMQAEILLSSGDAEKALGILKSLKQSAPPNPSIEFLLARGYLLTSNPSLARTALNRAIELYPIYQDAIIARARLDLVEGKTIAAISGLESLIAKSTSTAAQLLLAEAYQKAGRMNDAAGILKSQAESSSGDFRAHLNLGLALKSQGKMAEARASFEKAAMLSPDDLMVTLQLVNLELSEGKFAAAHAIAESRLRKDPNFAFPHYLQGIIYEQEKKWSEAEKSLLEAIKLSATLYPAYDALVNVYTASGRTEDAARQLEALLLSAPENIQALMQLGDLYQKMDRPQEAMKQYHQLLKINPDFAPALYKAGLLMLKTPGDREKAYSNLQRARALSPNEPLIAGSLGWILYQRGDYKRALALIEEAAGKVAEDPTLSYHLAEVYYVMGRTDEARVELRKAMTAGKEFPEKSAAGRRQALLDSLDAAQNVDALKALLEKEPNDVPALLRLGNEYQIQSRFADAAVAFQSALKINPELASAFLQLATIYAGPLNQPELAAQYGRKAREADPTDANAAAVIGGIALKIGNYDWAYTLLLESSRQESVTAGVWIDLAEAAYGLGRVAEAREILSKLDRSRPTPEEAADAQRFLKLTGINPKEAATARDEVDAILVRDPNYLPALILKAAIWEQSSDMPAAEQIYQAVLAKFPQFTPAQNALARMYSMMPGKLAQAESMAMAVRQKTKDDVEATETLARISYAKKDGRYTLDLLKEIARFRELTGEELLWQGASLAATNQKSAAVESLKLAIQKGLSPADTDEANALLERLAKAP